MFNFKKMKIFFYFVKSTIISILLSTRTTFQTLKD